MSLSAMNLEDSNSCHTVVHTYLGTRRTIGGYLSLNAECPTSQLNVF